MLELTHGLALCPEPVPCVRVDRCRPRERFAPVLAQLSGDLASDRVDAILVEACQFEASGDEGGDPLEITGPSTWTTSVITWRT